MRMGCLAEPMSRRPKRNSGDATPGKLLLESAYISRELKENSVPELGLDRHTDRHRRHEYRVASRTGS